MAFVLATVGYHLSSRKHKVPFLAWFMERSGVQADGKKHSFHSDLFTFTSVLWYGLFMVIWYIYTAGSSSFTTVVNTGNQIITSISTDIFNPDAVQGLALISTATSTPLHEITRYLHLLTIFFIVVGFMISLVGNNKVQWDLQYLLLSFGALCICIGSVILPYFASALNTSRIYQISLIFLAPFCVLGGIVVFQMMYKIRNISDTKDHTKNALKVFSVFFAIFLLFNSAWVYEITKDQPGPLLNSTIDFPQVNEREIAAAVWLTEIKEDNLIYADEDPMAVSDTF